MNDHDLQELCDQLSLEDKVLLLTGRDSWSTHPLPQIGLASMVLSDGPAGVRGATWDERSPSVNFPSPTAIAASWDREMVHAVGEGLGQEASRKGANVVLGPTINLQRTPFGGRHFEAFSEDPLLTSELATSYVQGIQSHGVGATAKHYVANDSETDRFTVDVRVDEQTLREVYLRAFEGPVVNGGAWLVMSAYNSVNGARATENELLRDPLVTDWGFDGVVVSDWTAVRSLHSAHFPQDLVMPGPDGPWGPALVAAVNAGTITESIINDKVIRILRLAARTGALEGSTQENTNKPVSQDLRSTVRDAAVAGSVLLTNSGLLPLGDPSSIAVIGEGAKHARTQGGGSATVIPEAVVSPLAGISERWPHAQVTWALGAVVERGLTDLPDGSFHAPHGEPGMEVVYLDPDGTVLATEIRHASGIVSFDAASLALKSDRVEMRLTYRPETSSDSFFPFAIAGLCDFEIEVDGDVIETGSLRTTPGDDPAAAVLHPPYTFVELPLLGLSADIVVRLRPVEGGIPDALSFRLGVPPRDDDPSTLIAEAVSAAAAADVAVVVVSTSAEVESEGFDRSTLTLPGCQDELVRAVTAANPRTIVVVNSGSPVLLPWASEAAAILAVWFPGQEAGAALADILSGDKEPGGRLPVTWPADEDTVPVFQVTPEDGKLAYREGVHIGYRAWLRHNAIPAFPFGAGLGYTSWEFSDFAVPSQIAQGEDISTSIVVANTGSRPGKAVVQLYVERISESTVDRPVRWLAAFEALHLAPGERSTLELRVPARSLSVWSGQHWQIEPGLYRLCAASSSADIASSAEFSVIPL